MSGKSRVGFDISRKSMKIKLAVSLKAAVTSGGIPRCFNAVKHSCKYCCHVRLRAGHKSMAKVHNRVPWSVTLQTSCPTFFFEKVVKVIFGNFFDFSSLSAESSVKLLSYKVDLFLFKKKKENRSSNCETPRYVVLHHAIKIGRIQLISQRP